MTGTVFLLLFGQLEIERPMKTLEVALQTSRGAPAGKLHLGFQIQAPQEPPSG